MACIEINSVLRQSEARALADALSAGLGEADLTVDLAGVTQIDAGILQVLVSATALADRTGHRLYVNMPEGCAALDLLCTLGLPPIGLPLPSAAAAT